MVDRGEKERTTDVMKARQVRSDEEHDDISKNLFSFGQSLLLEKCKQSGLINVCVCVFGGATQTEGVKHDHAFQRNTSHNVPLKNGFNNSTTCSRRICSLLKKRGYVHPHWLLFPPLFADFGLSMEV